MDNLQHIDDLLKKASQVPANALVDDSDWLAVENRLRKRKNRIYALWFFLALVTLSSSGVLLYKHNTTSQTEIVADDSKREFKESKPAEETKSVVTNKKVTTIADDQNSQKTEKQSFIPSKTDKQRYLTEQANPYLAEEGKLLSADNTPDNSSLNINEFDIEFDLLPYKLTGLYSPATSPYNKIKLIKPLTVSQDNLWKGPSNIYDGNHWEVGVSFTPSLSGNSVTVNTENENYLNRSYIDKVASSESISFANTIGFNAQYHFAKKWFIATGLYSTERSEALNYNYIIDEAPFSGNGPIVDYFPIAETQITYQGSNSYHFIEIPLYFGFKQELSRNFEIRTQVGASYLQLVEQQGMKADTRYLELRDLSYFSFTENNIGLNAKAGIYYHTKRLTIGAEPVVSRQVNTLTSGPNNPLLVKPYSYGFNITTNLKLIK